MKTIRIHLDAHAHVYPFHDVPRLLLAALDHMPRVAPTDLRVLCLAERADCSFFQALAQDEIRLPGDRWRIAAWDPDGGVKIRHLPDHRDLWILAGRQAAAAERIVVCALFSDEPLADGRPARPGRTGADAALGGRHAGGCRTTPFGTGKTGRLGGIKAVGTCAFRHSRESGYPFSSTSYWIPAYAGMTVPMLTAQRRLNWIPAYAGMTAHGARAA